MAISPVTDSLPRVKQEGKTLQIWIATCQKESDISIATMALVSSYIRMMEAI